MNMPMNTANAMHLQPGWRASAGGISLAFVRREQLSEHQIMRQQLKFSEAGPKTSNATTDARSKSAWAKSSLLSSRFSWWTRRVYYPAV
jgi:hypothetical protein